MASSFNTLQRRELFSLSLFNCKCFSASSLSSLHNSFAFSSPKHFLPLKLPPLNLVKTPVTAKTLVTNRILCCSYSTETVDFSNSNEILDSGYSSSGVEEEGRNERGLLGDGRKGRKKGGSFDFGKKGENERGFVGDARKSRKNGESFGFGKKGENERGVLGDGRKSRKSGESFDFGKKGENERGFVGDAKKSRNGESFDFGKKGENERGFVGDDRKSRKNDASFDFGKKGENERGFLGDARNSRRNGESFDFGKKGEKGGEISSYRKGGSGNRERKKEEILGKIGVRKNWENGDVRKDQNVARNRGHKGPWFASKRVKEVNTASAIVDRGAVKTDDNKVKKKEKVSKKKNPNSPEFRLRIGLDMCSKKGDVMGAISLYDSAVNEGARLAQYHYTVLLYLCSSAAMGFVRPAKSGSGSRSLDTVAPQIVDETSDSAEEEDDDSDDCDDEALDMKNQTQKIEVNEIRVSDDVKKYARERGFEIYQRMCLDKVQMNEAALTSVARMAMAMGDGDMAFDVVKQMKSMGISPKLRSYGPALSVFASNGEIEKAFAVEEHMLENGVDPEEPELEALLRVSVEVGKADRVYYVLHKLRTNVRSVSTACADLIEKWFKSIEASRVGKRKWDHDVIAQTMESVGGGWHGKGWLGSGKWSVSRTSIGVDGLCKCCGEQLALIDLDPKETEEFAESVAAIATKREKNSSFQKFQRWLDYYGPFEAVVDAANVGLYSQRMFKPSKVNVVVNGIRQMNPSRKWPLIVLHNKRVTGGKIDKPIHKDLVERWKNADALYATPTGSNDDWYWLYAAIRFKCLLVTNDEMRDHTFQLLGNDFFPKWKERHQVRFSFSELGPVFHMPPPCSVVIQESESGHWHIPIASEHQSEEMRTWLCVTRSKSLGRNQLHRVGGADSAEDSEEDIKEEKQTGSSKSHSSHQVKATQSEFEAKDIESVRHKHFKNTNLQSTSSKTDHIPILKALKVAEEHAECVIDFQI